MLRTHRRSDWVLVTFEWTRLSGRIHGEKRGMMDEDDCVHKHDLMRSRRKGKQTASYQCSWLMYNCESLIAQKAESFRLSLVCFEYFNHTMISGQALCSVYEPEKNTRRVGKTLMRSLTFERNPSDAHDASNCWIVSSQEFKVEIYSTCAASLSNLSTWKIISCWQTSFESSTWKGN